MQKQIIETRRIKMTIKDYIEEIANEQMAEIARLKQIIKEGKQMNRYAVIIYDDGPKANPHKIEFNFNCETKEEARAKGNKFAERLFSDTLCAVHVEYRGKVSE